MVLVSLSVNAQIRNAVPLPWVEIGKVGQTSLSVIKESPSDGINNYLLMYINPLYAVDINGIKFTATDNELNGLYDLMKTQMSAEKGTKKSLFLGTSGITLETKRALGFSSLIIYDLTEGASGYFYLSSKQLDKLFGKN